MNRDKWERAKTAAETFKAALERGFDIGDAQGLFADRAIEVWDDLLRIIDGSVIATRVQAQGQPMSIVAVTKAMRDWCKILKAGDLIRANSSRTSVRHERRAGNSTYRGLTWVMADKLERAGLVIFEIDPLRRENYTNYVSKLTAAGEEAGK